MTQLTLNDSTGATVTISIEERRPVGSYTMSLEEAPTVGRADFVDVPAVERERIFFHTEVDRKFRGRGLADLLVRAALGDSILRDVIVVPVCPLFAAHLKEHGDEFVAAGGKFRRPRPVDMALVARATGVRSSSAVRASWRSSDRTRSPYARA